MPVEDGSDVTTCNKENFNIFNMWSDIAFQLIKLHNSSGYSYMQFELSSNERKIFWLRH